VREAQRTYQKRKDATTTTDKRRADKLLSVLAKLSSDVEALLQSASKAGLMQRDDNVSKNIQQLWTTYDTTMNDPAVQPELRIQQMKNNQRRTGHDGNQNGVNMVVSCGSPRDESTTSVRPMHGKDPTPQFDPSAVSFELADFEETTVALPFQRVAFANARMTGKGIYQVVQERQAALKEADQSFSRGQ
jgi:hypothetical protein